MASDPALIYPTTSPDNFSGLVEWYEADSLNSIVAHRASLASLPSILGDKAQVPSIAGQLPTFLNGVCNGHSVVRFDATAVNPLTNNVNAFDYGDIYTVIVVCAFAVGGPASQWVFDAAIGATQNSGLSLVLNAGVMTAITGDSAGAKNAASTFDARDGKFHIYTLTNSNALLSLFIDGQASGTVAYVSPNPNVLNRFVIGSRTANSSPMTGDLAALISYSVLRTPAERVNLEQNYCRRKFFGTES